MRFSWTMVTTAVGMATVVIAAGAATNFILIRMDEKRCPASNRVGDPSYQWPHSSVFIDESGFGEALETFGYDVGDWSSGWSACSGLAQSAVLQFQADFNATRSKLEGAPDAVPTDGLIGDATVDAMAFVAGLQQNGDDWVLLVSSASTGDT